VGKCAAIAGGTVAGRDPEWPIAHHREFVVIELSADLKSGTVAI
jgi:hypothetical protein